MTSPPLERRRSRTTSVLRTCLLLAAAWLALAGLSQLLHLALAGLMQPPRTEDASRQR